MSYLSGGEAFNEIFEDIKINDIIAFEIGTHIGNSTRDILSHVKKKEGKLYCVDWFRGSRTGIGNDPVSCKNYKQNKVLSKLLVNIKDGGYENYFILLIGDCNDVSLIIKDNFIDFLFIDGDHDYDYFKNDLEKWYPKVKLGGIICGHDYQMKSIFNATEEFFGENVVKRHNHTIWSVKKIKEKKYDNRNDI